MNRRITMHDIAEACGVTVMTVSRCLNRKKGVREEVRERVLKTAGELGYRPDPALSALVRHRQQLRPAPARSGEVIPILVPERYKEFHAAPGSFFNEWLRGIYWQAEQLGYRTELEWLPASRNVVGSRLHVFYQRGVRGLLLMATADFTGVRPQDWEPFSIVMIGSGTHRYPFHAVRYDYFQMGECAMRALYERGYRRIGYFPTYTDRDTLWRAPGAIQANHIHYPGLHFSLFDGEWEKGPPPPGLKEWIRRFRPDVLISISYPWKEWEEQGRLSLPRSTAKVVLNRPTDFTGIAGVVSNLEFQGKLAVEKLHQLIKENETGFPETRTLIRVDGTWKDGSTARSL